MGYRKIVQYGDTTDIYEYEKPITKKGLDALKAHRLQTGESNPSRTSSSNLYDKRRTDKKLEAKRKGLNVRSSASIRRSKTNFFRLCHHNNCNAKTIHFVTLTFAYDLTFPKALAYLKRFMESIQDYAENEPLRYISVPELTKAGRWHFHLLMYNLPAETAISERETRNLQRQFLGGFLDISSASYTSKGIAGYMAKYMAKSLGDGRYEAIRGYNASRNILKVTSAGSNSFSTYEDLIIPTDVVEPPTVREYNVPYLGLCRFTQIKSKLKP